MKPALIVAIITIVLLVVIFFVTYVLNKKTPVPKGCETLAENEHCVGCSNKSCQYYKQKENEK